jgi:hypothetical protein
MAAAMTTATLLVKIVTDAKGAHKGLDETASKAKKFGKVAGAASLAVVGGMALLAKSTSDAASEQQQAFGAVESVYGKYADTVIAKSKEASDAVGLSAAAYGNLSAMIGTQLKNAGMPLDKVAAKTDNLITLGADLAATYGGSTADAVSALSSVLKGETDPIEAFGISLKQSDISARLAAQGQDKLKGKALKAAESTAALAIVTEQAASAQGQFQRESESAAGSQQRMQAQIENTSASLGKALLPAISMLAGWLQKAGAWAEKHTTSVQILAVVFLTLAVAILAINAAMSIYTVVTTLAASATVAAWAAALWPITLVIAAIGLVVLVVVLLWKKCETFRTIVLAVWSAIKTGAAAVVAFLKPVFRVAFAALILYVKLYWLVISSVFKLIKALVVAVASWVAEKWRAIWGPIKTAARAFGAALAAVWAAIRGPVLAVTGWIKSKWNAMVAAIKAAAAGLADKLAAPFNVVKDAVDDLIGYIDRLLDKIRAVKLPKISIPGFGKSANATATTRGTLPPLGRTTASRAATTGSGTGNTFIFNGVIDAPDAARRIRALMRDDDRRRRGVQITGNGGRSWQPA